ncbi:hypothetical protein N657DRAFT_684824 [Parathielavia appendiculata]|uniref:Uncharacterized protein n=1 Tax=Parathielavia appendiculata TaxID=2587402 RepID=A0AAN6YYJ6_9PEZI|nr:hypothetical protein N657DRAFT_684824 [Parathielavia appendiculata]
MESHPRFPNFINLPAEVRRDIWERAAHDIVAVPSVHFVKVLKGQLNYLHEEELVMRAMQEVREAAGPGWDQLPVDIQRTLEDDARVRAARSYRAGLVDLMPVNGLMGLAVYGYRPHMQFHFLAAVCPEAADATVKPGADLIAPQVPPETVICFVDLETEVNHSWPVFATRHPDRRLAQEDSGVRYKGQALVLPCTLDFMNFTPDFFSQTSSASSAPWSPTLHEACPELAGLRKVAFVYRDTAWTDADLLGTQHLVSYRHRLGLNALWPENLPSLREIFLIDSCITLKADKDQGISMSSWTSKYLGRGAAFYEVSLEDTWLWNMTTPDGRLMPVFEEAMNLQKEYGSESLITVKVLACVPEWVVTSQG